MGSHGVEVSVRGPELVDDDGSLSGDVRSDGEIPLSPGARAAAVARVQAHPLVLVAVVASLVAVGHGVWIWTHRELGALDPDEAGYIANALRYHRLLIEDPSALPRAVGGTGTAPLVPLLTVPLLMVGPEDPRTAMMVQPVLMVVGAVAVAGVAHRLAGPRAAVLAGAAFTVIPTVVLATQTYWLGLGAAAALACATWALLASDRLTNRWVYAAGAAVGAMLLMRTMALGFLPAAVAGAAVVAGGRRASWIGLARALAVTVAVAAPWWIVAREAVFGYLFSYGYQERATLFGGGTVAERLDGRLSMLGSGIGLGASLWWWVLLPVAALAVIRARRRWPGGYPPTGPARDHLAVVAVVVVGLAALVSTSNDGVSFELPIVALVVALGAAVVVRAPLGGRVAVIAPLLAAGVLQLASAWWLVGPSATLPLVAADRRAAQYEPGFAEYDPRFGTSHRDEAGDAAAEWAGLSEDVARHLRSIEPHRRLQVVTSGNFEMFNSNTVLLAAELEGWTPRVAVPDTADQSLDRWLTPEGRTADGGLLTDPGDGRPITRVLVLALHDHHLFTPDAEVDRLHRRAVQRGWRATASFAIPLGGEVVVMVPGRT